MPVRCQAIIQTNADSLWIRPELIYSIEVLVIFFYKDMLLEMSSEK